MQALLLDLKYSKPMTFQKFESLGFELIENMQNLIKTKLKVLKSIDQNFKSEKLKLKVGDFFLGKYKIYNIFKYSSIEHPWILPQTKIYNLEYTY